MSNLKSLWEIYYKEQHSYYNIQVDESDLFGSNASKQCQRFIRMHYERGQKQEALNIPFLETYNKSGKHVHTVSLYLLGCVLKDVFDSRIYNGVKRALKSKCSWYNYYYTWFLTCLYHDVASCIETQIPFNPNESVKHLEYYLGKWNIRHTPFNHQPVNRGAELNCYSEELIKNYFYYMANRGETDHGIVGGYLLFDRIKKNFNKNTQEHDWNWGDYHTEEDGRGLRWNIEHPDHFAYVADAIICHNLWTRNEKDGEEYKEYGLDPLIIKKDSDKVSIDKTPLQFMLRLLDSLEPTKRFKEITASETLKSVYISYTENEVKIGWKKDLESKQEFGRWFNTIKGLGDWMNVRISDVQDDDSISYLCVKFNTNR